MSKRVKRVTLDYPEGYAGYSYVEAEGPGLTVRISEGVLATTKFTKSKSKKLIFNGSTWDELF